MLHPPLWLRAILLFTLLAGLAMGAGAATSTMTFWGPGYLGDARATAIAPNGDIWVATSGNVGIFAADGTFKNYAYAGIGQTNAITFSAQGDPIIGYNDGFVAIWHGAQRVNATGFGQYSPWDVTVDDQGALYATDGSHGVIKKLDISGNLPAVITTYQAPVTDPMGRPYSVALDAQRRLFVSDEQKPGLWEFNNDGTYVQHLLPTTQCWRVRRGADGLLYVVTNQNVTVLDPATSAVVRTINTPCGYQNAMGFAIDAKGVMYFGSFYGGTVTQVQPDGTTTLTDGPSYRADLTVPDSLAPGVAATMPLTVVKIASKPLGVVPPVFSLMLVPATLPGEPDSNYANLQSTQSDPAWDAQRAAQKKALGITLAVQQNAASLQVTTPAATAVNLYQLLVHAEVGVAGGVADNQLPVRTVQAGVTANMTLYAPHLRSVFQQGEQMELAVILRSAAPLPVGTLHFSLVNRAGESLAYQANAPLWQSFPVSSLTAGTLTYRINTGGIYPGRYLLQAEYKAGTLTQRDTWPLQIVSALPATRFHILFPEWSAGYTDIWGPFTGKGMRADSAAMAKEGIQIYDTTILSRGADPSVFPIGSDGAQAPALMAQAAADPGLPAPERFITAAPLEIELQEALRNGMTVQRDIWGSHFLNNWGYAQTLGIARDNREPQLWSQWQREWPSWIGHRYLTLSLDEGNNPERVALQTQLAAQGTAVPTDVDLTWARNGTQRNFISDAPAPVSQAYAGIGADGAGNICLASRGGTLIRYTPDGKQTWQGTIASEVIDLAVATDGTVYAAHMGNIVSVTTPDGNTTNWTTPGFSSYSPRGICIEKSGTLLLSDQDNGRICRYTTSGAFVTVVADNHYLQKPAGLTTLSDGTIVVLDEAQGGLMLFKADGTPITFLKGTGGSTPGGKGDVCAAADDTLWATQGWGWVGHYDRNGNTLGSVGHTTFALGGLSLPMSVAMTPKGNLLVSDVAMPFAQEFTPAGVPVQMLGLNTLFADVRIDRLRYAWTDPIITTVWMPVSGQEGDPKATLQAFASQANGPWQALAIQGYSGGVFAITTPQMTGQVTLRLVWAPPSADVNNPLHADYTIQVSPTTSAADQAKAADIIQRQLAWTTDWSKTRMGTLVRWTQLSNGIRPGTMNTAPTNYGTPDNMAEGVWVPWRKDAVVAECENEGHDHGSFPLMGPWYMARALEGPNAKPVWCSLLQWYWADPKYYHRPTRDIVMLLGAGASGIGTGTLVTRMNDSQLAEHRKIVDRLQRLGDAMVGLDYPGRGGVAVLHSFTQESMDPYNEEQFFAAHAAWYDLLRAHIPTAVVSEEAIAQDGLISRFSAVLLPYIQFPLPKATMDGLTRFRQAGGEVWVDLGTRITVPGAKLLSTRYRPFWSQDAYYWIHDGYGVGGYDGNYEYWRMRQGSDQRLPVLQAALGKYAHLAMSTDDPNVYLLQRQGGAANYIFAGNDHFPNKPLYQTWLAADAPVPATANFSLVNGVAYDAITMTQVPGHSLTVNFTDDEPARIWAVLPIPIAQVQLTAVLAGNQLTATATVFGTDGKVLAAVIPIKVTITDAKGNPQVLWRSTDATGHCTVQVPVGWMAPQGVWTITAGELLGGKMATPVKVTVTTRPAAIITRDPATVLSFDTPAISAWLKANKGKDVWIALDTAQSALRPDAVALAAALQKRGIKAAVINITDLPETPITLSYAMPTDQTAVLNSISAGKAIGMRQQTDDFRSNGPQRLIMRSLILLGDPAQNRWLSDIARYQLTRRVLSPCYPGPGRALLQYVWAPFYDGYDALTICATDVLGVHTGIQALNAL